MTNDKNTLIYHPGDKSVPIPASEYSLQTVTAEPWFQISKQALQLEGLQFDKFGNLYFVEVFGGRIFNFNPLTKKLKVVVETNNEHPAAVKIHKDGRLFIACLGNFKDSGGIYAITLDGMNKEWIVPKSAGYVIDDLVFDSTGGVLLY
ncbi:hypothetical protein NG844_01960 [Enterococcus faecalis]|uniref:hypothetical protein n=1 Tax=Enterococcus faecalis TaxID=1351 RepID=UPI002091A521|nr:hypothetical protein [Enterococcus faecalis]MCO5446183.1 hypothetical protein [Enterococcus faecalis]